MRFQNTLKREVSLRGRGLHSGRGIRMTLCPAPSNTGIIFERTDRANIRISATVDYVSDTTFATTLTSNGVRVGTVEHLLAALSGLCIDNVIVKLDGPEVPIMDGSALTFVLSILEAGIAKQAQTVNCIKILKPLVVQEGQSQIAVTPYEGLRITYRLFYKHAAFGEQKMGMDITPSRFSDELAPARTFGFLRDVKMLKSRGLAKGGSLENAIVLGDDGVINRNQLRFKNEFVRHKMLDAIGDFLLMGFPVYGHILANKSGHTLHIKLIRKILACRDAWEFESPSLMETSLRPELTAQV